MSKNLVYSSYLDYYGTLLTDKQRDVLSLYYNEDYSLSEISDILGISRQGAMDLIHRGEAQLNAYEQKLKLSLHYKNLSEAAAMLEDAATEADGELKIKLKKINLLLV